MGRVVSALEAGQAGGGGLDAFVGGGKGGADVAVAGGSVERAGGDQDAEFGQGGYRGPVVVAGGGGPEVEAGLGVGDAPAGRLQGVPEQEPPGGVAGALLGHVGVVVQRGGHGGLDRRGDH